MKKGTSEVLKNLTRDSFKGGVRQNELVELALTHQFDTIDIDMGDMFDRAAMMGKKFACQFFNSASIGVGTFTLPLVVGEQDVALEPLLEKAAKIGDLAKEVNCRRARLRIRREGACAYHENFENHRKQIAEIAGKLAQFDVAVGLMLSPVKGDGAYQFIQKPDELLTLMKMIARPNVGIVIDGVTWQATEGSAALISKLKVVQVVDVLLADPSATHKFKLPSTEDDSFAVEVVRYLSNTGYEGTLAVTGNPEDFDPSTPNEVASRLSRTLEELYSKVGVATEAV